MLNREVCMIKRIFLSIVICLTLLFTGCDTLKVYNFSEMLPPLMDIETQYPYTVKITVTESVTGESVEFNEGRDHELIRMQLEGIQSIRDKYDVEEHGEPRYTVEFQTTTGKFTLVILSEVDFLIDGYHYESVRSGADLYYFASLFAK